MPSGVLTSARLTGQRAFRICPSPPTSSLSVGAGDSACAARTEPSSSPSSQVFKTKEKGITQGSAGKCRLWHPGSDHR